MDMESSDFGHLGMETFIKILLIYSLSPQAREDMEKLWTEDPYEIDIKLGPNCRNRSVEILNAYLKTIGLRIVFEKHPKQVNQPIKFTPIKFKEDEKDGVPIIKFMQEGMEEDPIGYFEGNTRYVEHLKNAVINFNPIVFYDDKQDKW